MPRESYRTAAKYWPALVAIIETGLGAIRRHAEVPEIHTPPPTDDWREGEMLITIAHGREAQEAEELARQLQAAVNLLSVLIQRAGGEIRLDRATLQRLGNLTLHSAEDPTTKEQVLRVTATGGNGASPPPSRILSL